MSDPKQRILEVPGSLGVGGAEVMILTAVARFVGPSAEVDFLVFGDERGELESRAAELGCRVLRMPLPSALGPRRFVQQLSRLLRAEGPYDVIHSHVNLASGLILRGAAHADVPVRIAHAHNSPDRGGGLTRGAYRSLSRALIRRHATALAACAQEAGDHLFGRGWGGRGVVIPNGVDVERFQAQNYGSGLLLEELELSGNVRLVGAIARLVPIKNHNFMLDVIALDRDEGGSLHLVVVGDGDLRTILEDKVRKLEIQDRVTFLGIRHDIPKLLKSFDVVMMPSWREGLPVSLIEAQASGTPTIVADTVTRETDLGLGLVHFLPLAYPGVWRRALAGELPSPPESDVVRRRFRETGYDSASSARLFAALLGLGPPATERSSDSGRSS